MLNNPTSLIDPLGLDAGDPMDCQYDANGVLRCGPTHRGKGSDGDGGTRVAQFGDVIASLIMGDGGFCTISMGLFSFTVYGCGRPSGGTPGRTTVVTKPGSTQFSYVKDLISNFPDRFNKSCFGQFLMNSAEPFDVAAKYIQKIPNQVKLAVAAAQSAGYYLTKASYYAPQLGTWATSAWTASSWASTAAGYAGTVVFYGIPIGADASGVYGLVKEWQAKRNGQCE